ncbi:MAG: autotransporter-associated beta strand repeat-containing protein, partial [Chthoniobacteraceae bacterium]
VEQSIIETLTDQVTQDTYTNTFFGVDLPGVLGADQGYVGFTGATGGQVAAQTVQGFAFNNFNEGVALANNVTLAGGATTGIEVLPRSAGGAGTGTIDGNVTFGADATLNVTGGAQASNTPYLLSFGGQTTIAGNTTINVAKNGTGAGALVIEGALGQSAPSSLVKTGTGSLTIGGTASYTGTTDVNGGTLIVNGSISGGLATVADTGTLGGTGSVNAVTVSSGGTLAPGEGIGALSTGALTLQAGSILSLEVGSLTADQVKIAGAASLNGSINLALTLTADPTDNTTFTILDGTAALLGYAEGARFSYLNNALDDGEQFIVTTGAFTQAFEISYGTGGGDDVALMAVPEPGTASCLIAGLGAILGLRRRRR